MLQVYVVSEVSKVIEVKKRLLEKHSLEAVFSMPNDLFHPINVNSCILILKAHYTHLKNKKTFFGYFKNDGFVKQKNSGRIDKNDNWKNIKDSWLEKYINKESVAGISIINNVTAEQEWCAEAYMETDYTRLTENDFIKTIKDYVGFLFLNNYIQLATNSVLSNQDISLETINWQYFYVSDIFEILEKAKCSNASVLLTSGEDIFYIGAKKTNNGVMEKVVTVDNLISKGNSIVFIGDGQGSIGYTNYQPFDFIGSTTLTLGYNQKLNKYNAMFLVTIPNAKPPLSAVES